MQQRAVPGPPFLFGACLVALAIVVLTWLPSNPLLKFLRQHSSSVGGASGGDRPLLSNSSQRSLTTGGGNGNSTNNNSNVVLTPSSTTPFNDVDYDSDDSSSDNIFQQSAVAAKLYRTGDTVEHRASSSV